MTDDDRITELERRLDQLSQMTSVVRGLDARIDRLEREAALHRIAACEAWVEAAPPSSELISVITPTHNRSALLRRAIETVQAQTHNNWEMIVVDDHSTDDTQEVLASIEDPRVRAMVSPRRGSRAARNAGLEAARGSAIVYLDDDNRMLPLWLRAVLWAFEQHPAYDVLYGARVHEMLFDSVPQTQFDVYDAQTLRSFNFIDTNVIAHRPIDERWDEAWEPPSDDWEFAVRVTETRPLLPLPVRAVLYTKTGHERQSANWDPDLTRMRLERKRAKDEALQRSNGAS